jgi:O-methyltransferase
MNISLFMAVNLGIGTILLILLARFAWNMWFSAAFQPQEWLSAKKGGLISKRLSALSRSYPDKVRFFAWWLQVERLKREKVPGAFAEVGVYKGESARALHHMDPARPFHLFDTFEGFAKRDLAGEKGEAASYTTRHFADTHSQGIFS